METQLGLLESDRFSGKQKDKSNEACAPDNPTQIGTLACQSIAEDQRLRDLQIDNMTASLPTATSSFFVRFK